MAYGLSNGHVTDDVTWPWKVKLVTPIRLERNISETTWARDFKFGNRLWLAIAIWLSSSAYCEAVRSAILATAWLLVILVLSLWYKLVWVLRVDLLP